MFNFLIEIRNRITYLVFFTVVIATSSVLVLLALQFCILPEKTLDKAVNFYYSLPKLYAGKIEPAHIFLVGTIFLGIAVLELLILFWVRQKTQSKNIINYKNPRVSINVHQLEKSIKESLTILTGINKSNIKIKHRKSGYLIKVYARIYVDEGIHIVQLEKTINNLIRKRVKEILLGISVEVKSITKIYVVPDKNYVSYNVLSEQNVMNNNRNFLNTNFPDNLDISNKK